jgi:hypothetical protein
MIFEHLECQGGFPGFLGGSGEDDVLAVVVVETARDEFPATESGGFPGDEGRYDFRAFPPSSGGTG